MNSTTPTSRSAKAGRLTVRRIDLWLLAVVATVAASCAADAAEPVTAEALGPSEVEGTVAGEENMPEIPVQEICGDEIPVPTTGELAQSADAVVIADLVSTKEDAFRVDNFTAEDPDDVKSQMVIRTMTFKVSDVLAGTAPSELTLEEKSAIVDGDGQPVSTVEVCPQAQLGGPSATADTDQAQFLLFISESRLDPEHSELQSSYGVARVSEGEVVAVGGSKPIAQEEASSHPLADLVGQSVSQVEAEIAN